MESNSFPINWGIQIVLLFCVLLASCKGKEAKTTDKNYGIYISTVKVETPQVMLGDSFHAKIYLDGYPKYKLASITIDSINGQATGVMDLYTEDGVGFYDFKTITEGINVFNGRITIKALKRGWDIYFFRYYYEVDKPKTQNGPNLYY